MNRLHNWTFMNDSYLPKENHKIIRKSCCGVGLLTHDTRCNCRNILGECSVVRNTLFTHADDWSIGLFSLSPNYHALPLSLPLHFPGSYCQCWTPVIFLWQTVALCWCTQSTGPVHCKCKKACFCAHYIVSSINHQWQNLLNRRPLAHDRQFFRCGRLASTQRPKDPLATLKAPETFTGRNRFGIVLRRSDMIATALALVRCVLAARLLNATVHIKVRMSNWLQNAALQHIRMDYIHEIGIAPA